MQIESNTVAVPHRDDSGRSAVTVLRDKSSRSPSIFNSDLLGVAKGIEHTTDSLKQMLDSNIAVAAARAAGIKKASVRITCL